MRRLPWLVAGVRPCRVLLYPASSPTTVYHVSQRCQSSTATPSEEEVRKAYATLGLQVSATLTEVKKRYGELAMRHHPDVAQSQEKTTTGSGDSSHSSMVDINTAYKTVNQFHKTGGRLSEQQSQQKTQWHQRRQDYSQTNHAQRPYEPLYEDVDPLFYEMLWEEMRRQNEKEEFNHSTFGGDFYKHGESPNPMHEEFYGYDPFNNEFFRPGGKPPPRKKNPNQNNNQQTRSQNKNQNNNNNTKQKTTTWPATDLQALVNMYQDGKSFEFIANAFNKKTAEVIDEFNRWSADNKKANRPPRRRPRHDPYYYNESPDDIPFELYQQMRQMSEEDFAEMMMDAEDMDDGIPYGYYMDEEHAMPYNGHHYMHNNNNNHNGGNHQARTGSKQKKRANSHTRGTPTYKAKNFHNMQNKKNKK